MFYLKDKFQQSYMLSQPYYKETLDEVCSDFFHWLYLRVICPISCMAKDMNALIYVFCCQFITFKHRLIYQIEWWVNI